MRRRALPLLGVGQGENVILRGYQNCMSLSGGTTPLEMMLDRFQEGVCALMGAEGGGCASDSIALREDPQTRKKQDKTWCNCSPREDLLRCSFLTSTYRRCMVRKQRNISNSYVSLIAEVFNNVEIGLPYPYCDSSSMRGTHDFARGFARLHYFLRGSTSCWGVCYVFVIHLPGFL